MTSLVYGQDFVSTTSGDWEDGATWGNASPGTSGIDFPSTNDNVTIASGDVVTLFDAIAIRDLDIAATAELSCEAVLRIRGHYVCNGVHSGSEQIRLVNGNDTIAGTGTITSTALVRVNNGRTIIPGSNLTRKNGNLRCPNSDTLINLGILNISEASVTGNSTGSFMNGPGATLFVGRSLINNGTLIASAANNTIIYHRTGNGNQNIKIPADAYYNLQLEGTATNSQRNITGDVEVLNDLTIDGPTLSMNGSHLLSISGDFTMPSGAFSAAASTVEMAGTATQTINGDFSFYNLAKENTSTTSINGSEIHITRELAVNAGTLNTNGLLVIDSDATGDGSIASIGGTINGSVTVDRYINAGPTNWRFLSSPVIGATILDWQDSFVTSGFPGSTSPSFPFVSVYSYNESIGGSQDNGYVAPSNASNALGVGTGYFVWSGNGNNTTDAFTVRVDGNVNNGSVNLPVTYTNNVDVNADGWCLVGNPYASAVDWNSSGWTKQNMDDAIYVWNADLNQFSSYVAGVGLNGGSNRIASSQAFFVKASSAAPVLTIDQDAKVTSATSFLRPRADQTIVKLGISQGEAFAESAIRAVPEATNGFDNQLDAYYLPVSDNPMAIYSETETEKYSINSQVVNERKEIPFFHSAASGTTQLSYNVTESTGLHCIVLIDHLTERTIILNDSGFIEFENSDSTLQQRFSIRIAPNGSLMTPTLCELATGIDDPISETGIMAYTAASQIQLSGSEVSNADSYVLYSVNGSILSAGDVRNGSISERFELPAGIYILSLNVDGTSRHFRITF